MYGVHEVETLFDKRLCPSVCLCVFGARRVTRVDLQAKCRGLQNFLPPTVALQAELDQVF